MMKAIPALHSTVTNIQQQPALYYDIDNMETYRVIFKKVLFGNFSII